jgi:hypothetical protein
VGVLVVNCSLFFIQPDAIALGHGRQPLQAPGERREPATTPAGWDAARGSSPSTSIGARDLLQVHPSTYNVVVSTENITPQ